MNRLASLLKLRDRLVALLAAFGVAGATGFADLTDNLPKDELIHGQPLEQVVGMALGAIAYAIMMTWLYRKRLVKGPLFRCGESRPASDYGTRFEPGGVRLLDGWHYH